LVRPLAIWITSVVHEVRSLGNHAVLARPWADKPVRSADPDLLR